MKVLSGHCAGFDFEWQKTVTSIGNNFEGISASNKGQKFWEGLGKKELLRKWRRCNWPQESFRVSLQSVGTIVFTKSQIPVEFAQQNSSFRWNLKASVKLFCKSTWIVKASNFILVLTVKLCVKISINNRWNPKIPSVRKDVFTYLQKSWKLQESFWLWNCVH